MTERAAAITFKGNPMTLVGPELKVGSQLPDAAVTGNDLKPITLASFKGKALIISSVPSVDTPVCDLQTKRFNEEAGKLGDKAAVLTVSMDLPFAFRRWCGAANATSVVTGSDYKDHSFGTKLGLRVKELGLLARAVIVADQQGKVTYVEVVKEATEHPNYDAALAAARKLL